MSNTTKLALEASLKKQLLHKQLDKITINDLTSDCGISRMSFYYHFKDKYDLEPSSRHLLYYLFVVKEMEQFKKNKAINHELSY